MRQQAARFKAVAASLAGRTKTYLTEHADIDVTEVHAVTEDVDHLKLRQASAVIGVGGSVGMLIAFSFSQELIGVLYERLTAGIGIPPDQEAVYRDATVTEIANVIVGNCTADFASHDERVSLSPPILLEDAKGISRKKNAMFGTIMMVTPHGPFDIHMVGPQDMFDDYLNYESENDNAAA